MRLRYFHGTSSIFLDSIIEFGLGGINPNIKYKNLELLKHLSDECERRKIQTPQYLIERHATLGMANQTTVEIKTPDGGTFLANYRHEQIYISLTLERALLYACDNKYGSEILEYCIKLFQYLKEDDANFSLPSDLNLFDIEKYIDKEHKAILIEVLNVNEKELETEYGENGPEYISNLRYILPKLSKIDFHKKLAYSNFKLLKPIRIEQMIIYEVDFEGDVKSPDFEFTMTKIANT